VDLARRERDPADRWSAAADPDRNTDARPADPGDERRRVDRTRDVRARRPAPDVAAIDPSSVVERREAPGRIVDPGPAPRPHPRPVADAVRRPADRHLARHPERAVLGRLLPRAVAVEVLGAGHLRRDVAALLGDAVLGAIALVVPGRELVASDLHQRVLRHAALVDPELRVLAGGHRQCGVARLVDRLPGEHGDLARLVEAVEPESTDGLRAEAPLVGRELELGERLRAAQTRRDA